jgi:hypothetical protein
VNFGRHNGSNFLLTVKINKEDVNWAGTIKAYVLFSGSYSEDDENELVIDDQDKLQEIKNRETKVKHLRLYENYVNEKMGVPGGLEKQADGVTVLVVQEYVEMIGNDTVYRPVWATVGGDGYPDGEIFIKLYINKKDTSRIYVEGGIKSQTMKIDKDGFTIDMQVTMTGEATDIWNARKRGSLGDPFVLDPALEKEIRRVVYHELTHVYEAYVRKATGAVELHNTETMVYDAMAKEIRKRFGYKLATKPIMDFMFLVYLAQATEVSARVPEAYSIIKDIPDPHEREKIIRASSMWKQAEDMINYNAQDYIDRAKHDVTLEMWPEFRRLMSDNMGALLSMIDRKAKDYMILSRRDGQEDRLKARELVTPSMRKGLEASQDIERFMHQWQGIINRAGRKLRAKLSKLTTI